MKSIELEIGLADSELVSYERSADRLRVEVRAWNNRVLTFHFRDVIMVRDRGASDFADVKVSASRDDEVLSMALAIAYDDVPGDQPYSVYLFVNADDVRTLDVVATGYTCAF